MNKHDNIGGYKKTQSVVLELTKRSRILSLVPEIYKIGKVSKYIRNEITNNNDVEVPRK